MRSSLQVDRSTPRTTTSNSPLAEQYVAVRQTTERLCGPLAAEDQMVQSMPDASPAKWHQAHTSWFFETFLLGQYFKDYRPLDERYRFVFNSYYKQLGGHPVRVQRGLWSRPSLDAVREYRRHVDEYMLKLLDKDLSPDIAALVVLGLNHEQQHQELIVTDIKHALWTNPLHPAYRERDIRTAAALLAWDGSSIPEACNVSATRATAFRSTAFPSTTRRHAIRCGLIHFASLHDLLVTPSTCSL